MPAVPVALCHSHLIRIAFSFFIDIPSYCLYGNLILVLADLFMPLKQLYQKSNLAYTKKMLPRPQDPGMTGTCTEKGLCPAVMATGKALLSLYHIIFP
jgi:hypothetical protein